MARPDNPEGRRGCVCGGRGGGGGGYTLHCHHAD